MEMNEARMSDRNPIVAGDAAAIGRARSSADEKTKKTIFAGGSVIGALAMGEQDALRLPIYHPAHGLAQMILAAAKRQAHIPGHGSVGMQDTPQAQKHSFQPGGDALRLKIFDQVGQYQGPGRMVQQHGFGHIAACYWKIG